MITPRETLDQLFVIVQQQQSECEAGNFKSDALYDIVENLALYQTSEQLRKLFDEFVAPVLKKAKKPSVAKRVEKVKKQQNKAYQLLQNILSSDQPGCVEFANENIKDIQNLVLTALETTNSTTKVTRLK